MGNNEIQTKYAYWSNKLSLPSNIPLAVGFLGRQEDLESLLYAKKEGKTLFVLQGNFGVGKTSLALKFCEKIKDNFEANIMINASSLSGIEIILKIIQAFNPTIQTDLTEDEIENICISLLNQHKTVLLLDDVEDEKQVERLIHQQVFIVITSKKLFLKGSVLLYVHAEEAKGYKRVIQHLDKALSNSTLRSSIIEMKREILKLEPEKAKNVMIAAGNANSVLDDFESLDEVGSLVSLQSVFDTTYTNLSIDQKELFRKLAVFPADFDLEAIKFISGIEDLNKHIKELEKYSLVNFDPKNNRLSIHRLTQNYALKKINPVELYETQKQYALYYGEFLRKLSNYTSDGSDKFALEKINLEKGYEWLKENIEKDESLAPICLLYTSYAIELLQVKLQSQVFIDWMKTGISASRIVGYKRGESNQLLNLAIAYRNIGDFRNAIDYTEQALDISNELGDKQHISVSLNNLGTAFLSLGEYERACEHFEKSLQISREIGNKQGESNNLGSLANVYLVQGRYVEAIEYFERAFAISIEIGDLYNQGNLLGNLGNCYRNIGDFEKAIEFYMKARDISQRIDDRQGEGYHLGNLGIAYHYLFEDEKSVNCYENALAIAREIGDQRSEITQLNRLGDSYLTLGVYHRAIECYEQALVIANEIDESQRKGSILNGLGIAYEKLGEKAKAKEVWERGLAIFEEIESPYKKIFKDNLKKLENI